jgi:hypothetical protein
MTDENGGRVLRFVPRQPAEDSAGEKSAQEPSTFMAFGMALRTGDLQTAGNHLSVLMELSENDGLTAARFFQERMLADPETLSKTMQVREAIAEGKTNAAMEALIECFGLDGPHALRAVSALRKMME